MIILNELHLEGSVYWLVRFPPPSSRFTRQVSLGLGVISRSPYFPLFPPH